MMPCLNNRFLIVCVALGTCSIAAAQTNGCPPRPSGGSVVSNPLDIKSQNGVLSAALTLRSEKLAYLEECFIYQGAAGPVEAPTFRLNSGDRVVLDLTNRLLYTPPAPLQRPSAEMPASQMAKMSSPKSSRDPCSGGAMAATSTNIHFHGLNIPPVCHQDDVLNTTIENTDSAFEFDFRIPSGAAPGMYWYHPHLHGFATLQVNGGASGVLIVNGLEKVKPQVAGLPERVFVVRQQFSDPNSWIAGPYQLTLNFQPAVKPNFPVIEMTPGAKEFWRVANATSQAFLALQVLIDNAAQNLEIIALDGIPVMQPTTVTEIDLAPAGRAEFIVQGPAANQTAAFWQGGFDTGPIGNPNKPQQLAVIQPLADAQLPPSMPSISNAPAVAAPARFAGLAGVKPTAVRKLYFSEATNGTNGPTKFFITLDGQTPKMFEMSDPPAITTDVGAVEDWTIENRTGETHAFHIHQIHFLWMATSGTPNPDPELMDTVIVPAWKGTGAYPSVKLRLDFRDPEIAGTFVYHCHVLDHEDAGMMATILVRPAASAH
jgi:FtsP/CotA-like multicopper oxidase with cupredoxin domain